VENEGVQFGIPGCLLVGDDGILDGGFAPEAMALSQADAL